MASSGIDREREFTDEQVGEWILNRIFNDTGILDIFSNINNRNWYSNKLLSLSIHTVICYYRKHQVSPTKETMIALFEYLNSSGKIGDIKLDELISYFNRVTSAHIDVDENTVNDAIELFVQDSGLYHAVEEYSSSRLIGSQNGKKVKFSDTLKKIHKFEDFKLDKNIGLDYFSDEGLERHWDYLTNPIMKLPTGIEWIDKVTSGGIYRDGHFLGVVAAAPNVGKSIILANLAYNFLKQDLTVLVISLEMSEMVYARRITGLITDYPIDNLEFSVNEAKKSIDDFRTSHPNAKLIIKEYPTSGATPMTIDAYIESLLNNGIKPAVVILDYLNLLKPSNYHTYGEKQYQQIGYITKEIRGLSTKFKIPFFSATQSNRAGYGNNKVDLVNISQSTAVAEDADFIISAYRFDEDLIQGLIKVEIIKSRLGSKDYPPHQYKIDKDTLSLIDKGDATIELSDDETNIANIISGNGEKGKKNKKCDENEYSPPEVDSNVKNSYNTTFTNTVSAELEKDFSFT